MTIAALRRLLDEELPHVPRLPAPVLPHRIPKDRNPMPTTTAFPAPTSGPAPFVDAPPVDELLAWADRHPDREVQNQAARVRLSLTGLHQRFVSDTELAGIEAEAARLQQRLAELAERQAELRPAKTKKKTPGDHDSATVRAWARAQGINVPPVGRVPREIVERWRASLTPHTRGDAR